MYWAAFLLVSIFALYASDVWKKRQNQIALRVKIQRELESEGRKYVETQNDHDHEEAWRKASNYLIFSVLIGLALVMFGSQNSEDSITSPEFLGRETEMSSRYAEGFKLGWADGCFAIPDGTSSDLSSGAFTYSTNWCRNLRSIPSSLKDMSNVESPDDAYWLGRDDGYSAAIVAVFNEVYELCDDYNNCWTIDSFYER